MIGIERNGISFDRISTKTVLVVHQYQHNGENRKLEVGRIFAVADKTWSLHNKYGERLGIYESPEKAQDAAHDFGLAELPGY